MMSEDICIDDDCKEGGDLPDQESLLEEAHV